MGHSRGHDPSLMDTCPCDIMGENFFLNDNGTISISSDEEADLGPASECRGKPEPASPKVCVEDGYDNNKDALFASFVEEVEQELESQMMAQEAAPTTPAQMEPPQACKTKVMADEPDPVTPPPAQMEPEQACTTRDASAEEAEPAHAPALAEPILVCTEGLDVHNFKADWGIQLLSSGSRVVALFWDNIYRLVRYRDSS